jgi:hypothetical protein
MSAAANEYRPEREEALAEIVRGRRPTAGRSGRSAAARAIWGTPVEGDPLRTRGARRHPALRAGALTLVAGRGHAARRGRGGAGGRGPAAAVRAVGHRALYGTEGRRRRSAAPWRSTPRGRGGSQVGRLPRQPDRRALRRRHRCRGEVGRAGDEERHRARPRQAALRQPRHARRADRGGLQGAAEARGDR